MLVSMAKQVLPNDLESRVIRAHGLLKSTLGDETSEKFAVLERIGAYEIRLVDPWARFSGDGIPVWIELFDSTSTASVDSFTSSDLRKIVSAAETFISAAKRLNDRMNQCDQ